MSIERERYDQMTAPASLLQRLKRLFVFPPLPREEPPTSPPTGGTSATKASYRQEPPAKAPSGGPIESSPSEFLFTPARALRRIPVIQEVADPEKITGFMSAVGLSLFRTGDWSTYAHAKADDLAPSGGIVEVEIRVVRVIREADPR